MWMMGDARCWPRRPPVLLLALSGILLVFPPPGHLGNVAPAATVPRAASRSLDFPSPPRPVVNAVYQRRCQRCHGPDGRGDGDRENFPELPDFTRHAWQQEHSDPQLVVAILEGKGHHMPAFAGRLSRRQADELVAYIRGLDPLQVRDGQGEDDHFEEKFRQLEKEWQDLRQQFRDLNYTPQSQR